MNELEKLRTQVKELTSRVKELEASEKRLLELDRSYSLILELMPERIYAFVVDPAGEPLMIAPMKGKMGKPTGYTLEESRTVDDWKKLAHPDDWPALENGLEALLRGETCQFELRLVSKEGEISWHKVSGIPDWDSKMGRPKGGIWCLRDITREKRAAVEMLRLERLRALGQMAAGISHNLNNILTTVIGPARMLEKQIEDPSLRTEIEYIIRSARRARDLVRRLNEAVRGGADTDIRSIPVNKIVQEAIDLTRSIWKDEAESKGIDIAVRTELGEVPNVKATRSGMLDILVNLLLNAVDAMPAGGEILICSEPAEGDVRLTVGDNGVGMNEQTLKRVFEPFFTTKAEIGTGLGLSTVFGAITRWGGTVDVSSSPGKGTKFVFILPAADEETPRPESHKHPAEVRSAKILVVEDVEPIRSLLDRVLSKKHTVKATEDGEEALRFFATGDYDVAVIDLGLSGIPGDRIVRVLRQSDPSLATILISGWELDEDDPRLGEFDFHLRKPFDDLEAVQDVIADAVRLRDAREEGKSGSSG